MRRNASWRVRIKTSTRLTSGNAFNQWKRGQDMEIESETRFEQP